MLNELFCLCESLKRASISGQSWHRNYKPARKGTSFYVLIDNKGEVKSLEKVPDDKVKSLRKWEESAGISFPAFNVPPLSGTCSRSRKKKIDKSLKSAGLASKLDLSGIPQNFMAMSELVKRAELLCADKLCEGIKSGIGKLTDSEKNAIVPQNSKKKKPGEVQIILELADRSSFPYPANHPKVQEWVNGQLMPKTLHPAVLRSDAFGQPLADKDSGEKFPSVRIPILGDVKLRAMSGEIPCQSRYGRTDAKSFPAGGTIRQSMKDGLEWLGNDERKGRTWAEVSGKGLIRGILFAYPSEMSGDPPELAQLFSGETMSGKEAKFGLCASGVVKALEGITKACPDAEVSVFVLTKPDGWRTKVLVSSKYAPGTIINAAQRWQCGCRNIPKLILNLGTEEKQRWIEPDIPFPIEAIRCLNTAYYQDSDAVKQSAIHGLEIGEGIDILIESASNIQATLERALHLAVTNARGLLLAAGHADHRRDGKPHVPYYPNKRNDIQLLPSILGLLLFKLNIAKGGYMYTAPFLVGQMLKLADILHKEYCQHMRKGSLPPQLIGNAIVPTALDNPVAAIARLSERIAVYQAWANTATGNDVGLAKWTLQQLDKVASAISRQTLPDRCSDEIKAQVLLGYLAHLENDPDDSNISCEGKENSNE